MSTLKIEKEIIKKKYDKKEENKIEKYKLIIEETKKNNEKKNIDEKIEKEERKKNEEIKLEKMKSNYYTHQKYLYLFLLNSPYNSIIKESIKEAAEYLNQKIRDFIKSEILFHSLRFSFLI
jgi:superoxide dismutase